MALSGALLINHFSKFIDVKTKIIIKKPVTHPRTPNRTYD